MLAGAAHTSYELAAAVWTQQSATHIG